MLSELICVQVFANCEDRCELGCGGRRQERALMGIWALGWAGSCPAVTSGRPSCAAACSTPTAEKTRTSAASVTKIGCSILLPIIFMLRPYGHATNFCIAHITVELKEVWPFLRLLRLNCADDDADRRKHWAGVFANKDFVEGFASKFRPLVMTQEVKLLTAAPWGPHP